VAEIQDLLDINVLVLGPHKDVVLAVEIDVELVLVTLFDGAHCLEEAEDAVPLNVVARGVLKDLDQRVAMMVVEMFDCSHDRSLRYFRA